MASERDFGGTLTHYLVGYLGGEHTSPETLESVLWRAGEVRTAATLCDANTWSSYAQYRRLLEAAAEVLGGLDGVATAGSHVFDTIRSSELTETFRALGSPMAVYEALVGVVETTGPAVEMTVEATGPDECRVGLRMKEPNASFRELCAFLYGLLTTVPEVFGYPAAVIVDHVCQCDGAPRCLAQLHWESADSQRALMNRAEMRIRLLEARLDELQHTVAELVSGDGLELVLPRVVAAARRAVQARSFVLDVRAGPASERIVYTDGVDDADGARITQALRDGAAHELAGNMLAAEVVSERRHYGHLVAIRSELAAFDPREVSVLDSYARLAASALDSAGAIIQARREAAGARALLELSSSLVELVTSEEMVQRLARAVPSVIDCDRVVVSLRDPREGITRVRASYGFDRATAIGLRSIEIPVLPEHRDPSALYRHPPSDDAPEPLARYLARLEATGSLGACSFAIMSSTTIFGWITVAVVEHPERLDDDREISDRLRGLAGQAAIAIRNARSQAQLVDTARQAGMAEIATNVLHNVGNVLNSVNVSANLVAERVRGSKSVGLSKAVELMQAHADDLGEFLVADPKGKALPGYLIKLAAALTSERESIEVELRRLSEGIAHIGEIVNAQQSLTGVDGAIEQVNLTIAVQDALRMAGVETQPGLTVICEVTDVGLVALDRHRLLLILVNLMTNAAYATGGNVGRSRQLNIRAEMTRGPGVRISVADNGEGIAAEDLTRIFGHGFTTHREGHGFGLHSSSLAAKEMGGTLSAHSEGAGHGAQFVLELPTLPQKVSA